jgi:hypothetical protein
MIARSRFALIATIRLLGGSIRAAMMEKMI